VSIKSICKKAKDNVSAIAFATSDEMNKMLLSASNSLRKNADYIVSENGKDIALCNKPANFIDRLKLTESRIDDIAIGLEKISNLLSPVGELLDNYTLENGLKIKKIRVPIGVIGIIYEARPNVTADAIGLCIKSGNAVVLRGSKDAILSNTAIVKVIKDSLKNVGFNPEFIQLIDDTTREGATEFMQMNGLIDVIIPRGGAGLIENAVKNATVPVIETGTGNCHIYLEKSSSIEKAIPIIINAKTQRTSVCNSAESLLIDKVIASKYLPVIFKELKNNKVLIKGCQECFKIDNTIEQACDEDFYKEYNDLIISVKIVENIDEAILHINKYSTHHSDSILTEDMIAAENFLNKVDSAAVYVNASTRFTDGFQFGLGAEMGISTQKLHARGPMGLKELTSYKYCITGNGQIRK
jgi:glutamate-5-semialdehyde dehydrogenase